MDIVELKGVNPKMLAGSASSVTNTAADRSNIVTVAEDEKKARRKYNQAYCEFDIVAAYNARKKQKSSRPRHGKDRPKEQRSRDHSKERSKSKKSEKRSELSKKIEDLTARNEKIKQLIENRVHEGDSRQDGVSSSKGKDIERSETISESRHERRRHREQKTRRSTRCCPGHDKHSIISEKSKLSKEIDKSDVHDESAQHKPCCQKEHSNKSNVLERKTESTKQSSHIPKITVRLRNNSEKHSSKSPDGNKSERTERKLPESKSQLIKLTNYEHKSRSSDRRHKVSSKDHRSKEKSKESRHDLITVYENENIMEETDSIMSKDTLRKSKTHTRASSFARESSNIRHNLRTSSFARESSNVRRNQFLEDPTSRVKSQEDEKRENTKKPDVQLQTIVKNEDSNESKTQALCTCEESVGSPSVQYKTEARKGNDESPTRSSINPRRELSFSNLNLQPNIYHYTRPPRMATTQTSVSRIETPGFGSLGVGVHSSYFPPVVPSVVSSPYKFNSYNKPESCTPELLSQTAIALRDIMQVRELEKKYQPKQAKSIKSKFMENSSFLSDVSKIPPTPMKSCLSKNSRFHKTRCDVSGRIVEIASKTCNDQQVTFTVEGVEPPRRLKGSQDNHKPLKIEHVYNIQVFPGITINQSGLKESDLQLLSHCPEKPKQYVQESTAALNQCNESQGTFGGSGSIFPFVRGLENTISEFKPKESTDVSYKFKKKCWSNKELPKKRTKDKKKKKTKITKTDMAVQTGLDELEEEEVLERDIGVSTADCNLLPQKLSKDMQVQVTFPELPSFAKIAPKRHNKHFKIFERSSRSDSNISFAKERFLMQTDYTAYQEKAITPMPQTSDPHNRKDKGMHLSTSKQKLITSSREKCDTYTTRICRELPVSCPRKCRPTQKHRKQRQQQQQIQCSSPHAVHPVMSTGSIREVPRPRKTRSKSLTYDRDSLVEKINFNKLTIKHHHQEIVALEKCLKDILCRLKEDDSVSKIAMVGDSTDITKSDNKLLNSRNKDSCVSSDTYNVSNDSRILKDAEKIKDGKVCQRNCRKTKSRTVKSKSNTKLSTSKFQRRKTYGEILKCRYRRAHEKNGNLRKGENEAVSPVRVKSVYKNYKGFVSSATSISSKISEAYSSSPYPQSIPSLNFCFSMNKPEQHERRGTPHRHSPRTHQNAIVKKKSKLYSNEAKYSKKKTKSIYDLLLRYINLAKDQDMGPELVNEESRIVVLSVSSLKLKKPSSIIHYTTSRLKTNRKSPRKVKAISSHEEYSDYGYKTSLTKPFYIGKKPKENISPKAVPKLVLTSEDSLENESKSRSPNLCPLTAIFNFEPPKQNYFVYNAEIFSTNKPKIDIAKTKHSPRTQSLINVESGRSSVASTSRSPDNCKLKTIAEEKPLGSPGSSRKKSPKRLPSAEDLMRSVGVADLSPVLSRKDGGYPSYDDVIKSLEKIDLSKDEKPKLTTFNCNDSECSNLIFNYTSKKDARDMTEKPSSKERSPKPSSSAYHTMTTIMDSKPGSFQSPSESDTALKNESGYESCKKSGTFRNFFKKKTLMDVFKTKAKRKSSECNASIPENVAVADNRLPACILSNELLQESDRLNASSEESLRQHLDDSQEQIRSPFIDNKTVMWFNFRKKKRDAGMGCDPWCVNRTSRSDQTEVPEICAKTCHKSTKCMSTNTWKGLLKTGCPCAQPYEKQREQCKKYASKVLMEAAQRQKGYEKQYKDFEEMSLKVLMGDKSCACEKLRQGCTKSYANKAAGIQVKSPKKSEPVQVKPRSVSILEPPTVSTEGMPVSDKSSPGTSSPQGIPSFGGLFRQPSATPVPDDELQLDMSERWTDESGGSIVGPSTSGATAAAPTSLTKADDVSSFRSYTDKEIFDRLLRDYERKDAIADRLSADAVFHRDQIDAVKSGEKPDLQIQQDRDSNRSDERARGPRFSDRPKPMVHVTTDTTVRPDDIGTCFARGFRPDNLMLSGDACFHINKQDKIKMSPYMLKNTESIIDFSERETPLDFLLALGFMVDEASNALKDDDIRSRLLAAITEARVWINKITTTQGTLLYLVAYKARPETMRYFLQLVEAIINKRINNAIRLDGFLRVLEDVEAGRVQMINILGEDKFEDEENEEKIIKKQLKSLFITVYTIAEKEASVSGRTLTSNQVSLLRILVAKYRAGLHPHLELIARYIGQGLLENDIQLEAAMIFLSRLDTSEVKLKEFENYCGITCQLQDT